MKIRVLGCECVRYILLYWTTVLGLVLWVAALAAVALLFPGREPASSVRMRELAGVFLFVVHGMLWIGVVWGTIEALHDLLHPPFTVFFLSRPVSRLSYFAVVLGCSAAALVCACVAMVGSGALLLAATGVPGVHMFVVSSFPRLWMGWAAVALGAAIGVLTRAKGVSVMSGTATFLIGCPVTPSLAMPLYLPAEGWLVSVLALALCATGVTALTFIRRDVH